MFDHDPDADASSGTSLAFTAFLQEESSHKVVNSYASPADTELVTQADSLLLTKLPLELRLAIYKSVILECVDRKWHIFWTDENSLQVVPSYFAW
jgi:hypothetical protein